MLPPAFGSAYVGENFSCALCANNELPADADRTVSDIKISAEMQAPTQTIALDLEAAGEDFGESEVISGNSLQYTVRFDLKEEGNHILAVSLSYFERTSKEQTASSGRVRSFRKLYQFVAAPCLSVRTKVSDYLAQAVERKKAPAGKVSAYALEAQLENMADGPITLTKVTFNPKPAFKSTSINWDMSRPENEEIAGPFLVPRDITQVAFLITRGHAHSPQIEVTKDGRTVLGQLTIQWRTAMGDAGFLSTGWLTTKR